jgi:hypothetical protein
MSFLGKTCEKKNNTFNELTKVTFGGSRLSLYYFYDYLRRLEPASLLFHGEGSS